MKNKDQSGFALVALVLIVVVVAALSFVAIEAINKNAATTPVASQVTLPSKIQSKGDINQTIKSLDATPIDSKLDSNQFDSDIRSLL